jgi:hypothetical protein
MRAVVVVVVLSVISLVPPRSPFPQLSDASTQNPAGQTNSDYQVGVGAQAFPKQQGHLAVWQAVESCEGLVGVIGHAVVVC